MFQRLETALGLPKLSEITPLITGESGKRVERLLARVERLSKDSQGLGQAVKLLELLREMDKAGTLQRLDSLLKDILPLMKSKGAAAFLGQLDKLAPLLEGLLKE